MCQVTAQNWGEKRTAEMYICNTIFIRLVLRASTQSHSPIVLSEVVFEGITQTTYLVGWAAGFSGIFGFTRMHTSLEAIN